MATGNAGGQDPLLLEQGDRTVFNSLASAGGTGRDLALMTLNLQYFASYPKDEEAARARLKEATVGCDFVCVQEGLASKDVLTPVGFELSICAGKEGIAQPVHDMVYGDAPTLRGCDESVHNELLCNQIYRRQDSPWIVLDSGAVQISTDLQLVGGGGRAQGNLAKRSMVWVKTQWKSRTGPVVYVMCAHFTGGRFEDQYFVQQLVDERFCQPTRIVNWFENRSTPQDDDVGILLGDFNATTEYTAAGPMHGYFKAGIENSAGVQADATAASLKEAELCEHFKRYMISPFTAIQKKGWTFAYDQRQVGVTSGFGHLIDHMASSRAIKINSTKVIHLTNQKFGNKPKDTDLPLTDHNSVKTIFYITGAQSPATQSAGVMKKVLGTKAVVFGASVLCAATLGYLTLSRGFSSTVGV